MFPYTVLFFWGGIHVLLDGFAVNVGPFDVKARPDDFLSWGIARRVVARLAHEIPFGKVFAAGRQGVADDAGQDFPELQEEAFARCVVVGKGVETCLPVVCQRLQQERLHLFESFPQKALLSAVVLNVILVDYTVKSF